MRPKAHHLDRRRHRLWRALVVLGFGLVPIVVAPAPAGAATVPTGTCVDFLYFDGLDSRHTAAQCASALNAAGYSAAAYDDQSAVNEVQRSNTDAVFFHAGHSLDYYDTTGHTAIALMFESPQGGSTFDGLLGDPTASQVAEGPTTICTSSGACTPANLVTYPWADTPQVFKFNLAVLESCATTGPSGTFVSEAQEAFDAGAGSVLGFSQDIGFPVNADDTNQFGDGWANRFWADAGAGQSYNAAAIDAANSVGNANGFGSWQLLVNPGAPQSLYPAQYFVL